MKEEPEGGHDDRQNGEPDTPDVGPAPSEEAAFTSDALDLAKRLKKAGSELTRLAKDAEILGHPDQWSSQREVTAAADRLRRIHLLGPELSETSLDAAQAAKELARLRGREVRETYWAELREHAAAHDVRVARLTQEPFEIRVSLLTCVIDFEKARISIRYAREEIDTLTSLDARRLVARVDQLVRDLEQRSGTSEDRFQRIITAYRMARAERKLGAEELIDLVDLIPVLSLISMSERKRRTATRVDWPLGRAQLAYDLAVLRRDAKLAQGDLRLHLGSATGRSASNKRNVLYIEAPNGEGQYYLSLSVRRQASRAQS